MITEQLGTRFQELRKASGSSQEKFALKAGMDRTYYASVDSGARSISICSIIGFERIPNEQLQS